MENFRISLVASFLLYSSLGLSQAREDTFIDESTPMHRYISLSVGSEKLNPYRENYDKWFYAKISGGLGERWLIAGLSISYHSTSKIISISRPLYTIEIEEFKEFVGAGLFFRVDGNYFLKIPLSLRCDLAIAFGYHYACAIEYKLQGLNVGIIAEVNFFQNTTQPIFGFGISFPLIRSLRYKQKHPL